MQIAFTKFLEPLFVGDTLATIPLGTRPSSGYTFLIDHLDGHTEDTRNHTRYMELEWRGPRNDGNGPQVNRAYPVLHLVKVYQ